MEKFWIIVFLITIIVFGIIIAQKNFKIKVIKTDLDLYRVAAERRYQNLCAYEYLFGIQSGTDQFDLRHIRDVLTQLKNNQMQKGYFEENRIVDLTEYFLKLQGLMFQKFILDLPTEKDSLVKIAKFDYTHMQSQYSTMNEKLKSKVLQIWQYYVDQLETKDQIDEAFDLVKNNPFFSYNISSVNGELDIKKWYEILNIKEDKISERYLKGLLLGIEAEIKSDNILKLIQSTDLVFGVVKRKHLSKQARNYFLEIIISPLDDVISYLQKNIDRDVTLAKKLVEFLEMRDELYPVVEV